MDSRPSFRASLSAALFLLVSKWASAETAEGRIGPQENEPLASQLRLPSERQLQSGSTAGCFSIEMYDALDDDIAEIKNSISDDADRSHFLGGIVRMVAHDFMDYDQDSQPRYGADGCMDMDHEVNAGIPETIWCDSCPLKLLYESDYSHLSRADFWIASANAVIRQTSVDNELDLASVFRWGRTDRDSCPRSAERVPVPGSCRDIEETFLDRMGLDWYDAVALLGAHSLGRGHSEFSGHHGIWVANNQEAQVFDKKYYEEIVRRAWRPRNGGTSVQDWVTGNPNAQTPKMMLNTDVCLLYDIDGNMPCCTRTNSFRSNGSNRCGSALEDNRCPRYTSNNPRSDATRALRRYLGGKNPNSNNTPFYNAFEKAWRKATNNGWDNLKPLAESC